MSVEIPRAVQYVSEEQQERFSHLTLEQIVELLEAFRVLHMTGRALPPIPEHLRDLCSEEAQSPKTPKVP